jgi:hypothetical protein
MVASLIHLYICGEDYCEESHEFFPHLPPDFLSVIKRPLFRYIVGGLRPNNGHSSGGQSRR